MENTKKPEHFLLLFSYGAHHWTQLSVMSFLSAQARLETDIPKFRTVVVTDKPRFVKAYFGTWVELITIDSQKLKEKVSVPNGDAIFKLSLMHDFVASRNAKALSLESDVYFNSSPLAAFNALNEGKLVLGKSSGNEVEKAVFGFSPDHLEFVKQSIAQLEDSAETYGGFPTSWVQGLNVHQQEEYFHYNKEFEERKTQIMKFFERNYYREMGELYTMASLFTPELWHLPESELPQELL